MTFRHVVSASVPSGLAAAFVIGMLLVPSASAAPFNPLGLHHAPYAGTLHVGHVLLSFGCGAASGFTSPIHFNLSTGVGRLAEKSTANGCGPSGFSDYAVTYGYMGFDSPKFLWGPNMLPRNFSVAFSTVYVTNLTATPMNPAGGPFAWASSLTMTKGVLWDLTTSTLANSFTLIVPESTNTSANATVNQAWNLTGYGATFFPGNLTAGHTYIVQMFVEAWAFAYAPSGTTTHASARINMASGNNHYRADSWKIG